MTDRYEFSLHGRPALAQPYHLKGISLPNVYLLSGVTIEEHPSYGRIITIEKIDDLHFAIGRSIVRRKRGLTGDEMRFLRKRIGLTQPQLGEKLRVSGQTVANYEKGKINEIGPADIALRLLYLAYVSPDEDMAGECRHLAAELADVTADRQPRKPGKRRGRWSGSSGDNHAC
jgi:transcriptional regulator with XRE-family HTH domain